MFYHLGIEGLPPFLIKSPRVAASIRAYIVDDEPLAVKRLVRLLGATGRFELAGSTSHPRAAAEFLSKEAVDVVFPDIRMPGMTGFRLLAGVPERSEPRRKRGVSISTGLRATRDHGCRLSPSTR
jgi:DNA-binding NarL/FixJ family response regulator